MEFVRGTFSAYHLSMAARRAARANGLATAGTFEPLSNGAVKVYSPKGQKFVLVTRADIQAYSDVPGMALESRYPPARIVE